MAARKKWRRKLMVQGQSFLWYVNEDRDGMGRVLHLFTPDKSLAAQYWLRRWRGDPCSATLVISERGVSKIAENAPAWEPREVAAPRFVAEIAEWVLQHRRQQEETT